MSLAALLGLSLAYNAPPFRLKSRPLADSLANVLYALPSIFFVIILTVI